MRFGYSIQLSPIVGRWVAGGVFFLVGCAIFVSAPSLAASGDRVESVFMRVLGGIFLGFGALILMAMGGDLVLKYRAPERRDEWQRWINFGGGMLGAGLFSVPSAFAGPAMVLAYLHRPNLFFPADRPGDVKINLAIGFLFSLLGLGGMALMYFVARGALRRRSSRRKRRA